MDNEIPRPWDSLLYWNEHEKEKKMFQGAFPPSSLFVFIVIINMITDNSPWKNENGK